MGHHYRLPPEADQAVRSWIRRHRKSLRLGILVAFLVATILAIMAAWAAFRGAVRAREWLAGKALLSIPRQWEQPLGEAALAQMRNQVRFITDPRVLEPIRQLAAPLFSRQPKEANPFTLVVADSKEINAMALPGGFIVCNRGLLERARGPEEIQGVLAHEMAHIIKRHGVLQLAQTLGLDLALQQLRGQEENLRDALVRDSARLLGLKFSRDHERVADDLSWDLLQQAEIDPRGMVSFFGGLKAATDTATVSMVPLLSSHPAPQERIDSLRKRQLALGNREFKSMNSEFRMLQTGLGILLESP